MPVEPDLHNDLVPFPESGKPSGSRIASADAARKIFQKALEADELSAHNRAVVQEVLDGAPPYGSDELARNGNAFRYNLNFGEMAAMRRAAVSAYTDLTDSVETMLKVYLPPTILDPLERTEAEEVMAEELHELITSWPLFDTTYERLVTEFIDHGVSFAHHKHDVDWKFDVGGWDDFLMPRRTKVGEENIPWIIARREYLPSELYACIENEEQAEKLGWNVQQVRKALVYATRCGGKKDEASWWGEWQSLQKRLKNNDLEVDYAGKESVRTNHLWVREFNGKLSHYIFLETADYKDDFLFKGVDRFDSANSAFTVFIRNVGNGEYHSIRGLCYDAFPFVQTSNRIRNSVLDGTMMSMTTFLQPKDAQSMDEPPLIVNGPVSFINPEMQIIERNFANPATQALPILQDLSMTAQNNLGSYKSRGTSADGQERTKYEVMSQQENESSLTVSQINVFYRSWGKLLGEIVRRVKAIKPTDKRYPEVQAFYERCEERGIAPEIVQKIRKVEPNKAVGSGNAQQRLLAIDFVLNMYGSLDEKGKRAVLRDAIASRMGRQFADRYAPKEEKPRPVIDEKIAMLENADLKNGEPVEPQEGENHAVHAAIHLDAMIAEVRDLEELRASGGEIVLEEIQPRLEYLQAAIDHVEPHIEALAGDKLREQEYGQFRKTIQNVKGIFIVFLRLFQKMARRQAEEGGGSDTEDAEMEKEMQKHQLDLQMMAETAWTKRNLDALAKQQKMQFDRAKADAKFAELLRKQNLQLMQRESQ